MNIQEDKLKQIADVLRVKTNTQDLIPANDFASVIASIETGITPTGTINITENGTHDVTNYANASVDVETGVIPEGTLNITENGSYDVTNYVSIDVSITPKAFNNIKILDGGWRGGLGSGTRGDVFYRLNGGEWIQLPNTVYTYVTLNNVQKLEVYGNGGEAMQVAQIFKPGQNPWVDTTDEPFAEIDDDLCGSWDEDNPLDITFAIAAMGDGCSVGVWSDD